MAFPEKEVDIRDLLLIWKIKLVSYKGQFVLTDAQLEQVSDDADMIEHIIAAVQLLLGDVDEIYAYKKNLIRGVENGTLGNYPVISLPPLPTLINPPLADIEGRNRELYNYLKNHPNRTDEALADLGISTSPKTNKPESETVPTIGGKPKADDTVDLTFNKQGEKAIRFRGRLAGENWTWTIDATDSPVTDTRPSASGKPEKREYQASYLRNNKPYGEYSTIITVVTTP